MAGRPDRADRQLVRDLRRAGLGDVDDGPLARALYSSDASLYRVVPRVVVRPRHVDEVAAVLAVCREAGVPLTCRGGGTSIAGNAVGPGVVVDFSRHLDRVRALDPQERTAVVEPGVVHGRLQRVAAGHGLRFGPDPSSGSRCTIGGMIGNDACGTRALAYGRTSANVRSLRVVTASGDQLILDGPGPPVLPDRGGQGVRQLVTRLRGIAEGDLATLRTEFGRFGRQVSGYALEHLLPERGFDLRRLLVGSEGTLAVVVGATLDLVAEPGARVLVVLGYPDMAEAADAVPAVLPFAPTACEGLDARIVAAVRALRGPAAVPPLPRGGGWLFVEVTGDGEAAAAAAAARQVVAASGALEGQVVTSAAQAAALWRIREDGAGLAGRAPSGAPAYPGWEDSAVPPFVLGAYLRELEALLLEHGLTGMPYGHFGEGCVHLRLDFPLAGPAAAGTARLRAFVTDAARLVARYGGSLSGEHGDGRARGELLPLMYGAAAIALFGRVKAAFDPDNLLNPGVLVDPRPLDADVREAGLSAVRTGLGLRYPDDGDDFAAAVHRCSGIGRCRAPDPATGVVMCPSYVATREEKDSTRGRARVLQEMVAGAGAGAGYVAEALVGGGWRADEVHRALDLCLACRGCAVDCPAGVDLAAYKAEVLYQAYRHRLRPRSHYTLGRLPRWVRSASGVPGVANALLGAPVLSGAVRWLAGVDPRRSLPELAPTTFRAWYVANAARMRSDGEPVVLWVDTFTDHFSPEVGVAAVRVLQAAGYAVRLSAPGQCCGLTWISTGQLDTARKVLGRAVASLAPAVAAGVPVVGLEPSCTAVLRDDVTRLVAAPEAATVASATVTLAQLLEATPRWRAPAMAGLDVVAQPHCHHAAVLGWDADEQLLRRGGAEVTRVGGCCGLAGNFGMERGHYEVSVAVAESALLPAVRSAPPGAVVLADGFSCRHQLADLDGRTGVHLAQLIARHLDNGHR